MKSNSLMWVVIAVLVIGGIYWFMRSDTSSDTVMTETPEVMVDEVMAPSTVTVSLAEQSELGQSGLAVLEDNAEGMLMVTLTMTGGEFAEPQPAHIHLGACPSPGGVEYPLTNVVDGESVTTLDVSWADLVAAGEPLAINVHKSAAEASVYTACGDLPIGL